MAFSYTPSPTLQRMQSTAAFVKLVMGPVGGGKSSGALMEVLRRCIQQRPFKNIRYSKVVILRNTMAQLNSTVKPLIDQWLVDMPDRPMGEWKLTSSTFVMRFKLKDGTIVHADLILMAADTPEDVRRLLSVECSFAWVEECREVAEEVFSGLQGRTNRYPSVAMGGVTEPGVIGSTNPPPIGGFWHKVLTNPPKGWAVFIQPPAMLADGSWNPERENIEHLAPDYYENLVGGKSKDWVDVYLKNQYGAGGAGRPVFRNTFRKEFHVAKEPLRAISNTVAPIVIGMDNGLTAAAVLGQMDALGRVNVLDCAQVPEGETMGVERFLDTILLPKLTNEWPARRENVIFTLDPACFERSQINEKTIAMAIQARGFRVHRAISNSPERRIGAVEGLLSRAIDGGPGLLFSPKAGHVINAVEYGFMYKPNKDPAAPLVMSKNWYSHVADALQYLAMYFAIETDPFIMQNRPKARVIERRSYMYT